MHEEHRHPCDEALLAEQADRDGAERERGPDVPVLSTREQREQGERDHQQIEAPGDPQHRLRADRGHGEEERDESGRARAPLRRRPSSVQPEEDDVRGVDEDVAQVQRDRRTTAERHVHPEREHGEGPVVAARVALRGCRPQVGRPDASNAGERPEGRVVDDERPIVPDGGVAERRGVRREDHAEQAEAHEERPVRRQSSARHEQSWRRLDELSGR